MTRTRWQARLFTMRVTVPKMVRALWHRFHRDNARYADADVQIREGRTDVARLEALHGRPQDPAPLM